MPELKLKARREIINRVSLLTLFFCLITSLGFASLSKAKPTSGTIRPASGLFLPGVLRGFTCTYVDADGWTELKEVYLLISTSTTLINSAYLYYDQNTNLLYLRNDTNTSWLGGYSPGSAQTIENSQVKLNCGFTTVSGSGNTLSITFNLTFKNTYSGRTYNTYLSVKDDTGNYAGWSKKGTYAIDLSPQVGSIIPSSGTGRVELAQEFIATYSDSDGWQNIQDARLLIATSTRDAAGFYGYYDQNTNKLYLRNDDNTAWLGGHTPGAQKLIENAYAKLLCSSTTVSGSDTTLTIRWVIIFKQSFSGSKNIYLYVKDDVNTYAAWTKVGTWAISNSPPQVGTITPSSGTSRPDEPVNFITTYTDPDGWQNIQYVYLLISTYANGENCFLGYYHLASNKLYLRNDANLSWLGGYAPGSSNIISNSYVSLDCSSTTVSGSGANLSINWSVTFKNKFSSRTNNSYLYIKDNAAAYQTYTPKGTWTVLSANPQHKIALEAETASLITPFTKTIDPSASMGECILIPNGSGANQNSPGGPGVASFTFSVPNEDTYHIWVRFIAPTISNDSLFVQVDSGPIQSWFMPQASSWSWAKLKNYGTWDFYTLLSPGTHTLYFRQAEDGTKLDKVIIINDPFFVPGAEDVTDVTPPTGSIKIDYDRSYTNSPLATLSFSSQDNQGGSGIAEMQLSNDGSDWLNPEPIINTKAWTLTSGDGTKTVYVRFKDVAGNWSDSYSDTIILDTLALQITGVNPTDKATFYEDDTLLISVVVEDTDVSPLEYQFSIDEVIKQSWSGQSSYSWLPAIGNHNIKIEVKDVGGQDTKQVEVYVFRKPIAPPD